MKRAFGIVFMSKNNIKSCHPIFLTLYKNSVSDYQNCTNLSRNRFTGKIYNKNPLYFVAKYTRPGTRMGYSTKIKVIEYI